MPQPFNESSKGVYIISATPFHQDQSLDLESTDTLIDFYLEKGVDGITILGVMGEAPKLTEEESLIFVNRVIKRINGRIPVVVGVSHVSNLHIDRLSKTAMDTGAAGVMLAPIPGLKTDDQVYQYVEGVFKTMGDRIPVCYQDYPQSTGVYTSVSCFNRMIKDFPQIVMLKHEEFPGLRKITQLRHQAKTEDLRRVSILVGNNGLYIPQEMLRGADGVMTGFSYPEMLAEVVRLFQAGRPEEAEDVFDCYLPLIKHEFQVGIALAIRKEILRRRGAIKSAMTRSPGPILNTDDLLELERLINRLEQRLSARG
jgi:4-hydroxy-tetrahydrodipicolinate synthase